MLEQYSMTSELQILVGCIHKKNQLYNTLFFFNIIEDS